MCGICGQLNFNANNHVNLRLLKDMTDALEHRGPDAEGFHVAGALGLGHRRLKIIDLAGGVQPMYNEDKSLVVVFNGEIYNYLQLKNELTGYGHQFQSNSDTEVLLHGFEQWGRGLVEKLRGMFAFAIWDEKSRKLFIARDRIGIKPLYYYFDNDMFLFASEIKSILCIPSIDRSIDYQALDDYMTYMYISAPKSVFKNIRKLHPGHFLTIKDGKISEHEYWDIEFDLHCQRSESHTREELLQQLQDSVRVRMMSDVPLGAFLSGGIDSSAVVGVMADVSELPIHTATIGFNETGFNELFYARLVAKKYNTEAYEKIVDADAANILDQLAWHYDEPFADSSMVPTYYVSQIARDKVTVCLSGDGGDENFAGYRRYRFDYLENQVRALFPSGLRRPFFGSLAHIYPKADWLPQVFRAKTLLHNLSLSPERAYYNSMSWFSPMLKASLYSEDLKSQLSNYDPFSVMERYFEKSKHLDPLSRIQYIDMKTYLVDDILTKVDRASMAHSLEVRVPLLDHQFMQFAATIPPDYKLRRGEGKVILKKAVQGIVPDAILNRPKQGFSIPLADWLRNKLKLTFEERVLSSDSLCSSLFNVKSLQMMWNQHQRGTRDYSYHLWALLMLESWALKFNVKNL